MSWVASPLAEMIVTVGLDIVVVVGVLLWLVSLGEVFEMLTCWNRGVGCQEFTRVSRARRLHLHHQSITQCYSERLERLFFI